MSQTSDLLSQAGGILRNAAEPGWDAIASRVVNAVRRTPRAGGWPLLADGPDLPGSGHLFVSENVLRSTLAVTLRQRYLCLPTAIDLDVEDGALRGVHVDVTGSYGTELRRLADGIRATTVEVVAELLGTTATDHHPIDITITDVVTGDPLQS
ncbi:hypothetical protein MMAD_51210 [Mycolicibacterium madagascariense]|uniref:Asp23/Gls24 family envelope stress response protein n=1 Tax=Mycolicibacterium madagascariense TaxID=212765 RepID=A0A7I7XNP5_9MYCO|nr:hypothetical protein [Mycolicibacterium madagascariense]MCV7012670.1 hypothetical protein [Mycolicibacterium madagascariense]BBZ30826.1 hypothetical protein MMAD_51210 [Mycolicibacterium madagascariense]